MAFKPISELARVACNRHKNIEKAVAAIKRQIHRTSGYLEWFLDEAVDIAVHSEVFKARHNALRVIKRLPAQCARAVNSSDCLASAAREALLDSWTLPNSKVLGDAYAADLLRFSNSERNISRGHIVNSVFYAALASRIGAKRVRDALTARQVEQILLNVQKQMAQGKSQRRAQ